MKKLALLSIWLALPLALLAQTTPTTPQGAFASTTYTFSLAPFTLPNGTETLSGAETDVLVSITPNNAIGETSLVSTSTFIGGRYDRAFPSIAKWLQNQTALAGYNWQAYITVSGGVVKASKNYWGERGGIGLRWAPSGTSNFSVAFEAQANNLPGISHWVPSISVSPQFRF